MQTSSFAISLSAFLVWISPVFLFPCFLQNHLSSAITTCVIPHPHSCLSAVCRSPAVDPVHWLCFHVIKDFTLSLLWQILVCLAFLLEEPLWPDPSWVTILTFSHPRIVEKHHFLASFPQNHCTQEIGSWSSFPSFSFKLFKRTYESASHLVVYHHLHTHLKPFVFSLSFPYSFSWLHVSAGFHPATVNLRNANCHPNVLGSWHNPPLLHSVLLHFSDFSCFFSQQQCHLPGWPMINVMRLMYSAFVRTSLLKSIRSINQGILHRLKKMGKLNMLLFCSTASEKALWLVCHCRPEQQCCIPAEGAHCAPNTLLWHYFRLTQGDRCLLLNHQQKCLKHLHLPRDTQNFSVRQAWSCFKWWIHSFDLLSKQIPQGRFAVHSPLFWGPWDND